MPLRRAISPQLTLWHDARFPFRASGRCRYRHRCIIGIGGNVGDVKRRFNRLFTALLRQPGIQVLKTAPMLENPPFGYLEQPDFINSVMELSTPMQPRTFLRFLMRMEKRFGRKRTFANAPRTLDLDILFFDGRTVERPDLRIPHPHWHERESVVIPLAYLWSE